MYTVKHNPVAAHFFQDLRITSKHPVPFYNLEAHPCIQGLVMTSEHPVHTYAIIKQPCIVELALLVQDVEEPVTFDLDGQLGTDSISCMFTGDIVD